MLLLSESIAVIRITLTVIYLLTLGALLFTKSKLSNLPCLKKEVINSILNKVKFLGVNLRHSKFKLRLSCYSGILLGYSLLTIIYILLVINPEPLIAIVFLIVVSFILLNTRYLYSVKISCTRLIEYLGPDLARVKVVVKPNLTVRVRVCDSLVDGVAIVKGSNCSEYVTVEGGGSLEYEYLALNGWSKIDESDIIVSLTIPLALHERVIKLKPNNIITKLSERAIIEIKELRRYLNIVETLIEPSVSYVRPYAQGNDIKLLVSKSLLKPGGLRVKVLDKHKEVRSSRELVSVYVVPDNYFCDYAAGFSQLKMILRSLLKEGIDEVMIGGELLSVNQVMNDRSKLCSDKDWSNYLRILRDVINKVDVIVTSPESIKDLIKLIKESNARSLVLSVKVIYDNSIETLSLIGNFKIVLREFQEWINTVRRNIDEVTRDKANLPLVMLLENVHY